MSIPHRIIPPGPDDDAADVDNDVHESSSPHSSGVPSSVGATDSDGATRLEDAELEPDDFDYSSEPSRPPPTVVIEGTVVGSSSVANPTPVTAAAYSELNSQRGITGAEVVRAAVVSTPPSAEKQALVVGELQANKKLTKLKLGQTRFVIAKSWMQRWEDYVGADEFGGKYLTRRSSVDPPGPITNEDILEPDGVTVKEFSKYNVQYASKNLWDVLFGWYGGTPIERPVVKEYGVLIVELHPINIKLSRARAGMTTGIAMSRGCTMGDLKRRGAAALQMGPLEECVGLGIDEICGTFRIRELKIDDDDKLLGDIFSHSETSLGFHLPADADSEADIYSSNLTSVWRSDYFASSRFAGTPGAVGLNNLGNTCFMNAAIQCLSHIPEVVEYFGRKDGRQQPFLEDLNLENPLGTQGELAKAFGNLVMGMWSGKERCIYPRDFRKVLCDHAQQFLGYDQHDSQEFLAYLLDGIHEDVNRVREKPFVEKVEAISGESDQTAARRAWEAHLRRNDSFIVDTMHGQYKSVVTCPVQGCCKSSTTFDPAMYLSVPLPLVEEKRVEVVLATLDGCRPKRYGLFISKAAILKELRQALSRASKVTEDRLAFTDVWQHKFHSELEDDQAVSSIRLEEVVVFELPTWPKPKPLPAEEDELSPDRESDGSSRVARGKGAGACSVRWEEKMSPFLFVADGKKELRNARDPGGRWRLLKRAQVYLDRFPSSEELAEFARRQESESESQVIGDGDEDRGSGCLEGTTLDLKTRLRDASNFSCAFTELETILEVEGFRDAVGYLRMLVEHEQPEVKVQIVQHRSKGLESYSSRFRFYGRTAAFSFPAVLSYLPHCTTVREFRERLTILFRRFVRPLDPNSTHTPKDRDGGDSDLDSPAKKRGEAAGVAGGEPCAAKEAGLETEGERGGEPGQGNPENVARLFRSGQLGLYSGTTSFPEEERNILAGGGDLDDDLISNWIDDTPSRTPKLSLRWSDDAVQEAYDSAEVQQVVDDPSVAVCRDREPKTLSMNMCLERFLEREQLDETEMWYCSSCKEHRRAYKEMSLWRLPPVLVLHLKRFSYTYGGWASSGEKIESFVTFPVRGLDMRHLERASRARSRERQQHSGETGAQTHALCGSEDSAMDDWVVVNSQWRAPHEGTGRVSSLKTVNDRAQNAESGDGVPSTRSELDPPGSPGEVKAKTEDVYDLCGVVNHHGMLNGGHYTAFALNERDGRWYDFSDDQVSTIDHEEDLVTAAAYVLFYRRRGRGVAQAKKEGAQEERGEDGVLGGGPSETTTKAKTVLSKGEGFLQAGADRGRSRDRRAANVVL